MSNKQLCHNVLQVITKVAGARDVSSALSHLIDIEVEN